MSKIEFKGVSAHNKDGNFLKDVTFSAEEGDFIMIKDPLLKDSHILLSLIHGFTQPTEGKVHLSIESSDYIGSNIIPFVEYFTVKEMLSLSLLAKGYSKKEIEERIEQLASYFSIEKLLSEKIKKLSKKEKVLIGLAKAVIGRPSIVLLSSFTQHLDHQLSVLVLTYLHEISIEFNVTILMVENDAMLHPFAAKVMHLEGGKVKDLVGEGVNIENLLPFLKI